MPVSNKPWSDFTQADYTPAQWRRACLIDTGIGNVDSKERYKVPVREPDGTINRNGVHAAAGGHGIGAVTGVAPDIKRAAAAALVRIYRQDLGETPPESLLESASTRSMLDTVTTNELCYRTYNTELEVRSRGDGRTISGIAVPWGVPVRIDDRLVEQWARGTFAHQFNSPGRIKASREHINLGGTLIGALTYMRDDAAGQYIELRASRTPLGDETVELVKDGALNQMSIAFHERQNRRLLGGIVERVKADMAEVAMVLQGAYGDLATATGVRSNQTVTDRFDAADLEVRLAAEKYLAGLPTLPDYQLKIRAIRLGIPVS